MEKSLHSFQQPSERLVFLFPVMVACDAFLLQWALQRLTGVLHVFALTCAQFGTGATGRRPGCPSALMECEDKGVSGEYSSLCWSLPSKNPDWPLFQSCSHQCSSGCPSRTRGKATTC